jgi:YegS/Rv2252/BmrU family lipid kinase
MICYSIAALLYTKRCYMTRHLFVVNPITADSAVMADKARDICARLGLEADFAVTEFPGHATEIVRSEAMLSRDSRIYILGGDGSLNEAVCGAAGYSNVALTHIPCGTGNDFIRCFGGKGVFRNIEGLINGREILLDLMDVRITPPGGSQELPRHAINICSVGTDADVAARVARYKWTSFLGSKMPYNLALITSVIRGIKRPYTVTADGEQIERQFTIITCCNGQVYGGGFKACPDSDPSDGKLEFLLVWGMSRLTLMRIIGKYAGGKYKELTGHVRFMQGSSLAIEAKGQFYANCDGEVFPAVKTVFSLSPHKLRFVLPKEED